MDGALATLRSMNTFHLKKNSVDQIIDQIRKNTFIFGLFNIELLIVLGANSEII